MARSTKPVGPSGVILPYEEARRLLNDPANAGKFQSTWGFGDRAWTPFQRRVLMAEENEIGLFGGKGSGKSLAMRAWLIKGNPSAPVRDDNGQPILWNISYMFHPGYRALILRKNQDDLEDFIARAIEMYKPYDIHFFRSERQFRHACGATIDCGHMKDRTAWQQFIGIEYVRVAIDEAPLIPEFESYDQLRSCQRTVFPELHVQTLLAGNAGGPGTGWLAERFMNARDDQGNPIPHDTPITEVYTHPLTNKQHTRKRIWMFSTWKDNPAIANTDYIITLMSLKDPRQRAAYIEGDWTAFAGSYFGDVFRTEQRDSEPAHACHVVKTKPTRPRLEPWFSRAIGVDWGYSHEAATLWLAQHGATGQLHVYREMVANKVGAERYGYEIALATIDELNASPDKSISLYLSHDAFQQRDERHSLVELMASGIARVLGPNAVHVPELVIKQLKESYSAEGFVSPAEERAREEAFNTLRSQRQSGITIKIAPKTSSIGWQYIREQLRWEHIVMDRAPYDPALARHLMQESPERLVEYARVHAPYKEENLPKMLIWDTCPRLIDAIPKAQYEEGTENVDKTHFTGKDVLDGWYHLCLGFRDEDPPEPWEAFRTKKLNAQIANNPNLTTPDLIWINRGLEAEWARKDASPAGFSIPRGGRRTRQTGRVWLPETDVLM